MRRVGGSACGHHDALLEVPVPRRPGLDRVAPGDEASEVDAPVGAGDALTDLGRDSFDQHYDDLAAQALRFLAETQGEDAVAEFAKRRVAFVERDYSKIIAANPSLSPAEALAEVFSQQGYAASTRELPVVGGHSAGDQLCQQHCPVSHVAHEFPELCEAETAAISRVLGSHVQRLATIAHGDGVCTTCIPDMSKKKEMAT